MSHDEMVRELVEHKSLDALIWLVEHGREVEFLSNGTFYFLSPSHSRGDVSLWRGQAERCFSSVQELVGNSWFLEVWERARVETVF